MGQWCDTDERGAVELVSTGQIEKTGPWYRRSYVLYGTDVDGARVRIRTGKRVYIEKVVRGISMHLSIPEMAFPEGMADVTSSLPIGINISDAGIYGVEAKVQTKED